MTAKRLTLILSSALAALLIGLVVGTHLLTGLIQRQATVLAGNKTKVEQLAAQEKGLVKSKRDIDTYGPLEAITKTVVPQDKDQAATVRELVKLASASKVPLTTITFPSSTLGTAPAGAKASTSTAASAAAAAKPNLSQLAPVTGLPGVYNLQITIGNNNANAVSFTQLTSFLRSLENNRRTAAVASINIQPSPANPDAIVFNLIINTYIKP